ncbi:uncharacterized protein METZ01_LOCUS415216, partial [marine metagenome]
TGATGFIGQRTCKALVDAGHRVWALSQNGADPAGHPGGLVEHSAHLLGDPLPEGLSDWGPETVVHLAWSGIPDYGPASSLANLQNQVAFFDQIAEIPTVRRLLVAGTCFEYGERVGVCREDTVPAVTTYIGWAKQSLREYALLVTADRPIEVSWFRIFYAYGQGQRSGGLLPSMLREAAQGNRLTLRNPDAAKDFVYVDDVARAFQLAVEQANATGTFNIGSGRLTRLSEIQQCVLDLTSGSREKQKFGSPREGETNSSNGAYAAVERISECLG